MNPHITQYPNISSKDTRHMTITPEQLDYIEARLSTIDDVTLVEYAEELITEVRRLREIADAYDRAQLAANTVGYGPCEAADAIAMLDQELREALAKIPSAPAATAPITDWPHQAIVADESVPEPGEGHAWIQWKGTNACMDVRCRCGVQGHVDAWFAHFYLCKGCGVTFAVGAVVRLYPVDPAYCAIKNFKPVTGDGQDGS